MTEPAEERCHCRLNDAWRCAKDRQLTVIVCNCSCHERHSAKVAPEPPTQTIWEHISQKAQQRIGEPSGDRLLLDEKQKIIDALLTHGEPPTPPREARTPLRKKAHEPASEFDRNFLIPGSGEPSPSPSPTERRKILDDLARAEKDEGIYDRMPGESQPRADATAPGIADPSWAKPKWVYGEPGAEGQTARESAEQFWTRDGFKKYSENADAALSYEFDDTQRELVFEFAEAYASSLRAERDQFEELMHAGLEDYKDAVERAEKAERELKDVSIAACEMTEAYEDSNKELARVEGELEQARQALRDLVDDVRHAFRTSEGSAAADVIDSFARAEAMAGRKKEINGA